MTESVRIGVTGHRFLAEIDQLGRAVDRAIDRIEAAFPGRPLTVLSPLAEGADRLVARAVLRRPGGALVVPLPLPVADYLEDFNPASSRAEFHDLLNRATGVVELPPAATRNEAYEQVDRYLADQSDVLIALWDGQDVQGQGGTGEVVFRALQRGIPVCHVKAGNRKPGTNEPTSLGGNKGNSYSTTSDPRSQENGTCSPSARGGLVQAFSTDVV